MKTQHEDSIYMCVWVWLVFVITSSPKRSSDMSFGCWPRVRTTASPGKQFLVPETHPLKAPIMAYTPMTPTMQNGARRGPKPAQFSAAKIPVTIPLITPEIHSCRSLIMVILVSVPWEAPTLRDYWKSINQTKPNQNEDCIHRGYI